MKLGALRKPLLFTLFLSPILTSCGGGSSDHQVVTDLSLSASTEDGDVYAAIEADFDLGNLTLPTLQFPVIHPKTGAMLGEIFLEATLDGRNTIELNVNISEAAQINGVQSSLMPNGQPIPVGGIDQNTVTSLPIDSINASVYLALAPQTAMAGFAIPIQQFDGIGQQVGGVNFFPAFTIGDVRGVAGIFTSAESGKSGLALFIDLSSVIDPNNFLENIALDGPELAELKSNGSTLKSSNVPLFYIDQVPSRRNKQKIEKALYKLHRRRIELSLQ
jgi:hypothetical protein